MGYSWGWSYSYLADGLPAKRHWLAGKVEDSYVGGFRILTV